MTDVHSEAPSPLPQRQPSIIALRAELAEERAAFVELTSELADARSIIRAITDERDKAYSERGALVAYLAACYPAVIDYRDDPDWPVVLIETPSGQMSWHFSRADAHLVGFLPEITHQRKLWDGHTTEQKYQRLAELVRTVATGIYGSAGAQ